MDEELDGSSSYTRKRDLKQERLMAFLSNQESHNDTDHHDNSNNIEQDESAHLINKDPAFQKEQAERLQRLTRRIQLCLGIMVILFGTVMIILYALGTTTTTSSSSSSTGTVIDKIVEKVFIPLYGTVEKRDRASADPNGGDTGSSIEFMGDLDPFLSRFEKDASDAIAKPEDPQSSKRFMTFQGSPATPNSFFNLLVGNCPHDYIEKNGKCWEKGSRPFVIVQNKLMEDFVGVNLKSILVNRIELNIFSGSNLFPNLPLVNATVKIRILAPKRMLVFSQDMKHDNGWLDKLNLLIGSKSLLNSYDQDPGRVQQEISDFLAKNPNLNLNKVNPQLELSLSSDRFGRISLSIPITEMTGIPPPLLFFRLDFMDPTEWFVIQPETYLVREILSPRFSVDRLTSSPSETELPFITDRVKAKQLLQIFRHVIEPTVKSGAQGLVIKTDDGKVQKIPLDSVGNSFVSYQKYQYVIKGPSTLLSPISNFFQRKKNGGANNEDSSKTLLSHIPIVRRASNVQRAEVDPEKLDLQNENVDSQLIFDDNYNENESNNNNDGSFQTRSDQVDQSDQYFLQLMKKNQQKKEEAINSQNVVRNRQNNKVVEIQRLNNISRMKSMLIVRSKRQKTLIESLFGSNEVTKTLGRGLEVVMEMPEGIVLTVIKKLSDGFKLISKILTSIGRTIVDFIKIICSFFNWNQISRITRVMTSHFTKTIAFIRTRVLGQKFEILRELSNFLILKRKEENQNLASLWKGGENGANSQNFTYTNDAIQALKSFGTESYGDILKAKPGSKAKGSSIDPTSLGNTIADPQVGKYSHIASEQMVTQQNKISGQDYTYESMQQIFTSFVQNMKKTFVEGTTSAEALKLSLTNDISRLKEEFAKKDFWSISLVRVLQVLGSVMEHSLLMGLMKAVELILNLVEVLIRIFGEMMQLEWKIPLLDDLFRKAVMKDQGSLSLVSLVCFLGAIEVSFIYSAAMHRSVENPLVTETEADLIISIQDPSLYLEKWYNAIQPQANNQPSIAGLRHNLSMLELRSKLSYLVGGVFCMTHHLTALVFFMTRGVVSVILISAPFYFIAILSKFPFKWIVLTKTTTNSSGADNGPLPPPAATASNGNQSVSEKNQISLVNFQFLTWCVNWSGLVIGVFYEFSYLGFSAFNILRNVFVVLPRLYLCGESMVAALKYLGLDSTSLSEESSAIHVQNELVVKYLSQVLEISPYLLSFFYAPWLEAMSRGFPLISSAMHSGRLYYAISENISFTV